MDKLLRPDEIIRIKEDNLEKHLDPKFCFSWPNYKGHIMDQMGELLREERFVDVTIYCENRLFRAHRIVLCGASPFLKELLESNTCPEPVISLANISWTHITWILQFIYSGQVSVPEEDFPEFLETAKLLQISILNKNKSGKKSGASRGEPPTKKARTTQHTISDPAQQQKVFFRTGAIMQEMQQNMSDNTIITIPLEHMNSTQIEVQAEEIVESTFEPEQHSSFNPHDSYCIPGGPPDVPPDTPNQEQNQSQPQKQSFQFESYQACTLKSTHSLAPKTCNMCGKVYSNLSNLRQHVNLVHTTQKSVECSLCGKCFKSDLYMRRHLICSHSVTPVKKDLANWKEVKIEIQNSSAVIEQQNVQQQIWSEMNAAVANLTQNIHSPG